MTDIKQILYATDLSPLSKVALDYAVYLAGKLGAELHVVHVVDDSYRYWLTMEVATVPAGPPVEELISAAQTQMGEFLAHKVPAGVTTIQRVIRGQPFVEIIRYAREHHMDMIVMGTHGRTGLTHVLMGSVAEKVVRKSACPVLTVRHPEHEFEMP